MKLGLLAILFTLALPVRGFASAQDILEGWLNESTDNLVEKWGVPDKHMEFNGREYFVYNHCGRGSVGIGDGDSIGPRCDVWKFVAESGVIVKASVNQ